MSELFWPGIVAMAVLYLAVFLVGVAASRRKVIAQEDERGLEELMLAGRSLPVWVGLLTMTATWVGGGYISGTAEATYSTGVLWGAQAGIGYSLSLVLGGLVFARTMRRRGYTTLVDPLEDRYGPLPAALLMVPAVLAELFWSAAILVALGTAFGTVVGLDLTLSIALSAAVAVAYTVTGGLRAVAYTDVVQLFLILAGLGIAIPFAVETAGGWAGLETALLAGETPALTGFASPFEALSWADWTLLFVLGGIPWNVYFQRVLASRDADAAVRTSVLAGGMCALMAIPPLVLGLAGRAVDWETLAASPAGLALGGPEAILGTLAETPAMVLPYLLRLAVPEWVAVLGLGAVAAAVMSSVDSSILSAASLVAWNGWRRLFRPLAPAAEIERLVKALILVLGLAATGIALSVQSVAALWYLCGDVVYCVLFPQLALALFDSRANRTGALAGYAVSVAVRVSGGDATLGIPMLLPWPTFEDGSVFPFRTTAMVAGVLTALVVARTTQQGDPTRALGPVRPDV